MIGSRVKYCDSSSSGTEDKCSIATINSSDGDFVEEEKKIYIV